MLSLSCYFFIYLFFLEYQLVFRIPTLTQPMALVWRWSQILLSLNAHEEVAVCF